MPTYRVRLHAFGQYQDFDIDVTEEEAKSNQLYEEILDEFASTYELQVFNDKNEEI